MDVARAMDTEEVLVAVITRRTPRATTEADMLSTGGRATTRRGACDRSTTGTFTGMATATAATITERACALGESGLGSSTRTRVFGSRTRESSGSFALNAAFQKSHDFCDRDDGSPVVSAAL